MKNIRFDKIILFLFAVLFSINIVNASQSEIDNAKKNTEEYCEDDIQKKGCVYDPTNTLYTQSGKIKNCNYYSCVTSGSDTQLVRGYQDSDANGNLVFAGCYKVKLNSTGEYFDNGNYFSINWYTTIINSYNRQYV